MAGIVVVHLHNERLRVPQLVAGQQWSERLKCCVTNSLFERKKSVNLWDWGTERTHIKPLIVGPVMGGVGHLDAVGLQRDEDAREADRFAAYVQGP